MNHLLGFAQLLEINEIEAEQKDNVAQIPGSGQSLLKFIDRTLAISATRPEDLGFLIQDTNPSVQAAPPAHPYE
jgi:hypothetical protein